MLNAGSTIGVPLTASLPTVKEAPVAEELEEEEDDEEEDDDIDQEFNTDSEILEVPVLSCLRSKLSRNCVLLCVELREAGDTRCHLARFMPLSYSFFPGPLPRALLLVPCFRRATQPARFKDHH